MKYELPKSLKREQITCTQKHCRTNYVKCMRNCDEVNWVSCWKKELVKDLQLNANISNEREAENYVKCANCGNMMISTAFNGYMCENCGSQIVLDQNGIKKAMKNDYLEIDENELNSKLSKIKNEQDLYAYSFNEKEQTLTEIHALNKKELFGYIGTIKKNIETQYSAKVMLMAIKSGLALVADNKIIESYEIYNKKKYKEAK